MVRRVGIALAVLLTSCTTSQAVDVVDQALIPHRQKEPRRAAPRDNPCGCWVDTDECRVGESGKPECVPAGR